MRPSQWEMEEITLVIPNTETSVSDPVTRAVFITSRPSGGLRLISMKDILESQNILRTLGTFSLCHSASRKLLRP